MSESTETFGEEVRRRRRAAELSQNQLSKLSGVARATIGNAESETVRANRSTERDIRRALEAAENGTASVPPETGDPIREDIARQIEALADAYPEDALNGDSDLVRGARHAYRMAARIARGEQS